MSDLEQHYEARGQATEPAVCPVCRGTVLWVNVAAGAVPYLTCSRDREAHFEWRKAPSVGPEQLQHGDDVLELEVVAAEVVGLDYRAAVASRLGEGWLGELAALHRPAWGNPPTCAGCRPGGRRRASSTVVWPCVTAERSLGMMKLTPSDIAITKE